MRHISICLSFFATTIFAVHQAEAAPGDVEVISSVNLSGGANIVGVPMVFTAPTLNIPGVLQQGSFNLNGVTNAGTYTYFPTMNLTVFSGVATGPNGPLPPGGSIAFSGQVLGDLPGPAGNVVGTMVISGFGPIDGTHLVTSP